MQTTNETYTQLPFCSSLPILRRDDNAPPNNDVRYLQQNLNANGYSVDTDGEFGPATQEAVINFQTRKHLEVDGIVGPNTWERLGACNATGC